MQVPEYYNVGLNLESMVSNVESTADLGGNWIDILKVYFPVWAGYRISPDSVTNGAITTDRLLFKRETYVGTKVQRWPIFVLEYKYAKSNEEHPTDAEWEKRKTQLKEYLVKVQNPIDFIYGAIAVNTYIRFYEYDRTTNEMSTKMWQNSGPTKIDLDVMRDCAIIDRMLREMKLRTDALGS